MAEYIEREEAIDCLHFVCVPQCRKYAQEEIKKIPIADVQPIRHGEWFISVGKDGKPVGTICPICGFAWAEAIDAVKLEPCLSLIKTNYCPNCGAKMDGVET